MSYWRIDGGERCSLETQEFPAVSWTKEEAEAAWLHWHHCENECDPEHEPRTDLVEDEQED